MNWNCFILDVVSGTYNGTEYKQLHVVLQVNGSNSYDRFVTKIKIPVDDDGLFGRCRNLIGCKAIIGVTYSQGKFTLADINLKGGKTIESKDS